MTAVGLRSRTASSTRTAVARAAERRARDVRQQVNPLEHHRRAVRDRSLDQRVDAGRDVVDLPQEAGDRALRRPPAARRARGRRRRRSGARRAGTRGRRRPARPGAPGRWRSRATNPSRPASCVATVDLPTPVTPLRSTTRGRSRSRMFHHWRKRASTWSDSSPATTSSASARSCSTSTSPEPLGDEPVLDLLRERERAVRRQPGRHQRLGHEPLRVGQPVVAADTDDRGAAARAHRARHSGAGEAAGGGRRATRPRSPPGGCEGTRPAPLPAPRASRRSPRPPPSAPSGRRRTRHAAPARRHAPGHGGGRGSRTTCAARRPGGQEPRAGASLHPDPRS